MEDLLGLVSDWRRLIGTRLHALYHHAESSIICMPVTHDHCNSIKSRARQHCIGRSKQFKKAWVTYISPSRHNRMIFMTNHEARPPFHFANFSSASRLAFLVSSSLSIARKATERAMRLSRLSP